MEQTDKTTTKYNTVHQLYMSSINQAPLKCWNVGFVCESCLWVHFLVYTVTHYQSDIWNRINGQISHLFVHVSPLVQGHLEVLVNHLYLVNLTNKGTVGVVKNSMLGLKMIQWCKMCVFTWRSGWAYNKR